MDNQDSGALGMRVAAGPLLEVTKLNKYFPSRGGGLGAVRAVQDVSFEIGRSETLGLVGESGSGKSTTGRAIIGLERPSSGRIVFDGEDVSSPAPGALRELRRRMQFVFQDPFASLNPMMSISAMIEEPLRLAGQTAQSARDRTQELLEFVGLSVEHGRRYPHEFSGGQRQRIGLARALALNPQLLILDEPVSALDVSIQAQVINLFEEIQQQLGVSYLFIAHDLAVVSHIARRVAVMYLGRIVEIGNRADVFDRPAHPYTRALLSAIPKPSPAGRKNRERIVLLGEPPNPANPPSGCQFRTRCWQAQARCAEVMPTLDLLTAQTSHRVACHFPEV